MNKNRLKPYMAIVLYFIFTLITYTVINYFLVFKFEIIKIPKMTMDYWFPIGIAVMFYVFVMHQLIKTFALPEKRKGLFDVAVIAILVIIIVITQSNIKGYFSNLEMVSTIDEIQSPPQNIKITSPRIFSSKYNNYRTQNVTGKYGSKLTFYSYFTTPFYTVDNKPSKFILCKKYSKTVRGFRNKSDNFIDSQRKLFFRKCHDNFKNINISNFKYYKKIQFSEEYKFFIKALQLSEKKTSDLFLYEGNYEEFSKHFGGTFSPIIITFIIGAILLSAFIFLPRTQHKYEMTFKFKSPIHNIVLFIKNYIIAKDNITTSLLVLINCVVFIILIFKGIDIVNPSIEDIMKFGGVAKNYINEGQYWRLISSIFIHAGLRHLFYNMLFLIIIGIFLEGILNKYLYFLLYLIAGVVSCLFSVSINENTILVGASGAIFGLSGFSLAMFFSKYIEKTIKIAYLVILGINMGITFIFGFFTNASNSAHISGLLIGVLLGFLYLPIFNKRKSIDS